MSTTKICAITNGTGTQGLAVARAMSEAGYHVRILTRDPDSASSKEAIKGISNATLVRCDVNDLASVRDAFEDAQVVYASTVPDINAIAAAPGTHQPEKSEGLSETEQGIRYADVAEEQGVAKFIWSTFPDAKKNSGGAYNIGFFQAKVDVQRHIVDKDLPAVFISPGLQYENVIEEKLLTKVADGHLQLNIHRANVKNAVYLPLYVEADLGRIVALVVENFAKFKGKTVKAFERRYSTTELTDIIERETKMKVTVHDKIDGIAKGSDLDQMWAYYGDSKFVTYGGGDTPDETLKGLGFTFTPLRRFVKEKLIPYINTL